MTDVLADESGWLAQQFETQRAHLRGVAYGMLGSLSDADDAVQEAWLRLERSGPNGVKNLGGWLTTVVARVCLDMLRSRKSRREEFVGVRMPTPIVWRAGQVDADEPEQEALLADRRHLELQHSAQIRILPMDFTMWVPGGKLELDEDPPERLLRENHRGMRLDRQGRPDPWTPGSSSSPTSAPILTPARPEQPRPEGRPGTL